MDFAKQHLSLGRKKPLLIKKKACISRRQVTTSNYYTYQLASSLWHLDSCSLSVSSFVHLFVCLSTLEWEWRRSMVVTLQYYTRLQFHNKLPLQLYHNLKEDCPGPEFRSILLVGAQEVIFSTQQLAEVCGLLNFVYIQ